MQLWQQLHCFYVVFWGPFIVALFYGWVWKESNHLGTSSNFSVARQKRQKPVREVAHGGDQAESRPKNTFQKAGKGIERRTVSLYVEEQAVGSGEGWQHFGESRNCLVIVMDALLFFVDLRLMGYCHMQSHCNFCWIQFDFSVLSNHSFAKSCWNCILIISDDILLPVFPTYHISLYSNHFQASLDSFTLFPLSITTSFDSPLNHRPPRLQRITSLLPVSRGTTAYVYPPLLHPSSARRVSSWV